MGSLQREINVGLFSRMNIVIFCVFDTLLDRKVVC